jgi:putative YphP/YqiW family bacilliredoxin
MPYPEEMIRPMREELTRMGVRELRTPAEVDAVLSLSTGTTVVFVNSVCGCAAGMARPGLALALLHSRLPDRITTVFAGVDVEATARAREAFRPHPPTSPQIALFHDGRLVHMIQRNQIEGRTAQDVARDLIAAFDAHCSAAP